MAVYEIEFRLSDEYSVDVTANNRGEAIEKAVEILMNRKVSDVLTEESIDNILIERTN